MPPADIDSNLNGGRIMVTDCEKTQLIDDYKREPVSALGMVLTCAIGLLVVVMLALIGIDIHTFGDAEAPVHTATPAQ